MILRLRYIPKQVGAICPAVKRPRNLPAVEGEAAQNLPTYEEEHHLKTPPL